MKNIIILTHGWSGSSVFAALLGRAGHWLGAETMRKEDYNTHENLALVQMNIGLLEQVAPKLNHQHHFDPSDVERIDRAAPCLDLEPLRAFVGACDSHRPWLWKDPRLTWTIRVWERVLDLDQVHFLVLTRETSQAWIATNLRRHVQSVQFTRRYNDGITRSNIAWLEARKLPYLRHSFEDLLMRPEATLDGLNRAFGCALSLDDLRAVSREPLYRKSRTLVDGVKAALIYVKNFDERDGRGRGLQRNSG